MVLVDFLKNKKYNKTIRKIKTLLLKPARIEVEIEKINQSMSKNSMSYILNMTCSQT